MADGRIGVTNPIFSEYDEDQNASQSRGQPVPQGQMPAYPVPVGQMAQPSAYPVPVGQMVQSSAYPVPVGQMVQSSAYPVPVGQMVQSSAYPVPVGQMVQSSAYPVPIGQMAQPSYSVPNSQLALSSSTHPVPNNQLALPSPTHLVPVGQLPALPLQTAAVQGSSNTVALESQPNGQNVIVVEQGAMNEAAIQNVQVTEAKIGNFNVTAIKGTELKVQQKIHQRHEIVETDQGIRLRRTTQVELRVYAHIYEVLILEATKEDPLALEEGGDPAVDATVSQKCTDICCQSCVCNFQNPFAKQKGNPVIQKNEILTPVLRRGRAQGWTVYSNVVFPLFSDIIRDAWVISELVIVLIALIFSIVTFSLSEKKRVFNIIQLLLTIISSLLAVIDGIVTLPECRSCRACWAKVKERNSMNINAETGNTIKVQATDGIPEKSCRKKCCACCKEFLDIVRAFLTEALVYPLLLCDIFDVIIGKAYEGRSAADVTGFILFLLSCAALLLYVYIARLLILVGMIKAVQERRKPLVDDPEVQKKYRYDTTIGRAAFYFQGYFFVHVCLQMLAQIMMFIAIGGKIRYDNRHFYDPTNKNEDDLPIYVSSHLWYMLISAYIMPLLGLLTFFIVTYYWVQEFPIGLCIDMIKVLQMPGPDELVKFKKTLKDKHEQLLSKFVRMEKLETQFKDMRTKNFCEKFVYPFKSPVLIVLCLIYAALQFAFIMSAALAIDEMGQLVSQILNGGGWIVYYIIAVIVGIIANVYVFAVAALWGAIIVGVVVLIALIIAGLCLCFLAATMGSSSRRRRSYI